MMKVIGWLALSEGLTPSLRRWENMDQHASRIIDCNAQRTS